MTRTAGARRGAGELLAEGWLPPRAAARSLGITVFELEGRARRHEIKRREIAPGSGLFLYEVGP